MKTQFKVGDKVTVTSWHFSDRIKLPQNAEITAIKENTLEPYRLKLEDGWGNSIEKEWWFKEGEFELTNNMSVKGKTFIYRGENGLGGFTTGREYICRTDDLEDWSAFLNDKWEENGWIGYNHIYFTLKEESKKILGYKFKEGFEKYVKSVQDIGVQNFGGVHVYGDTKNVLTTDHWIKALAEAGVLDLWFEPVYEEEKPKYIDYTVKYGEGRGSTFLVMRRVNEYLSERFKSYLPNIWVIHDWEYAGCNYGFTLEFNETRELWTLKTMKDSGYTKANVVLETDNWHVVWDLCECFEPTARDYKTD